MIDVEQIEKIFIEEFPADMTWVEISDKLDTMEKHPYFQELCSQYCDMLVDMIVLDAVKYDSNIVEIKNGVFYRMFANNVNKLEGSYEYYKALYYFFNLEYDRCKEELQKYLYRLKKDKYVIDEDFLISTFIVPFKNAFEGFWDFIINKVSIMEISEEIEDLLYLVA